jgi:trehalose 6-phosphate synthase
MVKSRSQELSEKADDTHQVRMPIRRDDPRTYYNGFTNRVLWPILHYRVDLAEFSRRDLSGYLRVNDHFARELDKVLRPDDVVWVHDYHLMPLARHCASVGTKSHRLFPSHPVPAAGNTDCVAQPRASYSIALRIRPRRLPDRVASIG